VGSPQQWDKAEDALRQAAKQVNINCSEEQGEAAFYGPKIDFVVKDVIGREWQLGTVQVDYNLPQRFDLHYIGSDNSPFGSLERFCGVLIEHFAGSFPLWLAPEQVRVLPISDKHLEYARKIEHMLSEIGVRATVSDTSDKIGAKIRLAQLDKVPYMLVLGAREEQAANVAVRSRYRGDEGVVSALQFVERVQREIKEKKLE
jgi:threonyl-tRNA synthetase